MLRDNLRHLPARRTLAVCGILGDKDIGGITATLAAQIDAWIPVTLTGHARSSAQAARRSSCRRPPSIVAQADDVAERLSRGARGRASAAIASLVFGSFLTVGPALEFLGI